MFTLSNSLSFTVLLLISSISPASAFWRLLCDNAITTGRYDPIVSPGGIASHSHTIVGGSGFGMSTSYEALRNSTCTSCQVKQDLSNYWIPSLYYQNANNGSFESVDLIGGMTVYYLQRGDNVKAFPPGFRMLAGNPNLRTSGSSLEQGAINYVCLDYSAGSSSSAGLPTKNCPQGLRAQIVFPSCWNGKDLDSANHKSHMAYPDGISTGNCPAGYPIRLVTIFFEVTFIVDAFSGRWYSGRDQPFVFAMGDPTGYGLHGDFVNGWDEKFLQSAVDTCTNASGRQEDCPLFDLAYNQQCHVTPQVNEVVSGTLKTLPGCNPVQFGPNPATAQTCTDQVVPTVWNTTQQYLGQTAPPTSHFLANQPQTLTNYSTWKYLGCYSDSSKRTFSASVGFTGKLTVESCLDACNANGYAYGGPEAGVECWCGNTAPSLSGASLLSYASCAATCPGNSLELCGGNWAIGVYNNTGVVVPTIPATSTDLTAKYAGCYVDNANRIMQMSMGTTNGTVDGCVSKCQLAGYPYSGIEYMGECYCASSLPASTLKTADTDCNLKCSGDKTKLCGAGFRMQVYSGKSMVPTTTSAAAPASTAFRQGLTYAGCYTDSTSARSLGNSVASNKTVEGCIASCTNAGYKIAGLEYGGECWCDNFIKKNMAKASESDCNMACSGNSAQTCGAGNRLSIYNSTALVVPSIQTSVGGMSYIGCYVDDSSRVMKSATALNRTIAGCVGSCQNLGYSQAGIQYGGECYCGPLASRSTKAPDADCSMSCTGDLAHLCGAGWRLQMYNTTSPMPIAAVQAGRAGITDAATTSAKVSSASSAKPSSSPSTKATSSAERLSTTITLSTSTRPATTSTPLSSSTVVKTTSSSTSSTTSKATSTSVSTSTSSSTAKTSSSTTVSTSTQFTTSTLVSSRASSIPPATTTKASSGGRAGF